MNDNIGKIFEQYSQLVELYETSGRPKETPGYPTVPVVIEINQKYDSLLGYILDNFSSDSCNYDDICDRTVGYGHLTQQDLYSIKGAAIAWHVSRSIIGYYKMPIHAPSINNWRRLVKTYAHLSSLIKY